MDLRRLISLYSGVMIVLSLLYFLGQPVRSLALGVLAIVSAGAIVVGVRRHRPAAARWWLALALALLLDAAGSILYSALPSAAGQLKPWNWTVWIIQGATFVLLIAATAGLARSTFRGVSAAIDCAIIVLGAGLIGGIAIALPYASAATGVVGTVRVLYVLRDVLIFAIVIHLATALRWTWSVAALLGGLLGFVTYDSLFRLARAHGERLSGTATDLGLIAFFLLIGVAALPPSMKWLNTPLSRDGRDASPVRLGLVVILALMPSVVHLRILFREPSPYEAIIFVAAALVLILALVRIVDIAWQLRRQVYGERVVRETVIDLADAQTASEIPPILERAVGRLFPPSVRHSLVITSGNVAERPGDFNPPSGAGVVHDAPGDRPDLAAMHGGADVVAGQGGGADVVAGQGGGADVVAGHRDGPAVLAIPLLRDKALAESRAAHPGAQQDISDAGAEGAAPARPSGPMLVVSSAKATLNTLRPRLETLATQAGSTLERIRLNEDNLRHTSESYFRTLVQNSTDVILILDDDDRVRYASPSAQDVFGLGPITGVRLPTLIGERDRVRAEQLLEQVRRGERGVTGGEQAGGSAAHGDWVVRGDGLDPARVEVSCRDLRADATIAGIVVTLRNVTKQRLLECELVQQALHDPLTNLSNRVPFSKRLEAAVAETAEGITAVLYTDLDDLKVVNDMYGHEAGDAMLVAVGRRLARFVDGLDDSDENLAARLGGDEFALLLTGLASAAVADEAAAHLQGLLSEPIHVDGHEVSCGVSIGVATTAEEADSGQHLLRNADIALYAAKGGGKSQWRHYEPWMRTTVMARLEVRSSLERAIDDDALLLEYQPIVALTDGEPVGFEALLRWDHPTRGRLSPDEFIDVAEESGLITVIGEWVLATAARAAGEWTAGASGRAPYLSVNVSARQFRSAGFIAAVDRLFDETDIPPTRMMLEITESLLLRDDETVWQDLAHLRRAGVRIAIDDFGTGYSALTYLRHVPLDMIKLDRSFTQSMVVSVQQRELVQGIVGLADILGLEVVAEGIETQQERAVAAQIGCTCGQGFLFSRPLPADRTTSWLRDWRAAAERDAEPLTAPP
jgi:diguanylate cyclase (GGDEF)-like protein/PAS domain S-box-containing protein